MNCREINKTLLIIITTFFFCVITSIRSKSQEGLEGHGFVQFKTENGLSNNSVTCIVQDKLGFIWAGTKDGLNFFDGKTFKVYRNNPNDPKSLADNHINTLFVDSKNRLWVGYERKGLSIYNKDTDNFTNFSSKEDLGGRKYNFLTANIITSITEDLHGQIWIATASGLNKYREDKNDFIRYFNNFEYIVVDDSIRDLLAQKKLPAKIIDVLLKYQNKKVYANKFIETLISKVGKKTFDKYEYLLRNSFYREFDLNDQYRNEISCLSSDPKGNLWLGYKNYGIAYFNTIKNTYTFYKNEDYLNIDLSAINDILFDKEILWIATNNNKIIKFDLKSKKIEYVLKDQNFLQINKIAKYSDNILVFATNEGVVKLDKQKMVYRRNAPVEGKTYSLSSKLVASVFVDQTKNIWAGTSDKGLNLSNYNKNFRIIDKLRLPISLYDNRVSSLFEDSDGNLWVGYYIGDIDIIDKERKSITRFSSLLKNPQDFKIATVFKIFEDSENNFWLSSYSGGLAKYNKETRQITNYRHNPNNPLSISNNDIRDIDEDKEGNLWLTTHGGGLNKLDKKRNIFTHYRTDYVNWQTGMIHDWLNSSYIDRLGNIWISSVEGVSIFNPKTNEFKGFRPVDGDLNSLSHNSVRQVYEDGKNNIWLATENGLNLFVAKDSTFRRISTLDGLSSANINSIQADDEFNLWVATAKGLSKISPYLGDSINLNNIRNRIVNYDELDGLQGTDFYNSSSIKGKDGLLYFGGVSGISYFNPNEIRNNPNKPKVYISNFKLFNETVVINKKYGDNIILDKNINETKSIYLNYKQNNISFDYIALNYIKSKKNNYAYILEGFDKDWNYVGNKTEVVYTNLNPGKYTFKVKASNNDGVWNNEGASLEIIITPPYWETWWFKLIVISVVIMLLASFYLYRIRSLKENQKQLEIKVNERTLEIKNKNKILKERRKQIEQQANELTKSNKELSDLNAVKDRLFSIIGHDLKNPLNGILGFSELLYTNIDNLDAESIKQYSMIINESANTTLDLLNNLLTWARSQSKLAKFEPEPVNLYKLFEENKLVLNELFKNKKIAFLNNIDPEAQAFVDNNMIDTVIRNLLANSIKFSLEKGEITATISKTTDSTVTISVKDTGIGMSQEIIDNLFKLDKNFGAVGTSGETGTGMGLILCKDFITKHHGKIWVESKEGEGSTFYFTLPRKEA